MSRNDSGVRLVLDTLEPGKSYGVRRMPFNDGSDQQRGIEQDSHKPAC
jgi:hypothetical protein